MASGVWVFSMRDVGQLGRGRGDGRAEDEFGADGAVEAVRASGPQIEAVPTPVRIVVEHAQRRLAIKHLSSGGFHTLLCSGDGQLLASGQGTHGRLGLGNEEDSRVFRVVEQLAGKVVVHVSAGRAHSCCLTADGEMYTWGMSLHGQLGTNERVASMWPKRVRGVSSTADEDGGRFVHAAAGDSHTAAVTASGAVLVFGGNQAGQCGLGHRAAVPTPTIVSALQGTRVASVAAGSRFCMALTEDGRVYAWGNNEYGQLGIGHVGGRDARDGDDVLLPELVDALLWEDDRVAQVAAGAFHALALTVRGRGFAWGQGLYGRLGINSEEDEATPVLVEHLARLPVVQVAAGRQHSVALLRDGSVWTWGNGKTALGHTGVADCLLPRLVQDLDGRAERPVRAIAAGDASTFAIQALAAT